MLMETPRSLRHEYDAYVENEIENYKFAISRTALLSIGDEAVAQLNAQEQFNMDELLLWAEVDKIIRKRLRIPAFRTWQRRRLKLIEEYRRPENLGLRPDGLLAREMQFAAESRVLVAGSGIQKTALYLAAHGCDVTALDMEPDTVERVMNAAQEAGLTGKLQAHLTGIGSWRPESELTAVVCDPKAFHGLTPAERDRAIAVLQSATRDGGIHLVETIIAGENAITLTELRKRYKGWQVSVEEDAGSSKSFMARKLAS
jgi:hypothetical protein